MSQDLLKLWEFLKGKKTFLIAAAGAIYAVGISEGMWQHSAVLDILLGSGAVATLRLAQTQTKPADPAQPPTK